MRTARTLAVLLSVSLAGCDEVHVPTTGRPNAAGSQTVGSAGAVSRPLAGVCETTFEPPPLPPPPVLRQVDAGTCQLAHLGRAAFHAIQDIDLATGVQTSVEITFTAADGDVLRASSTGTSAPNGPGVTFAAVMTFTGGTGRFVNAAGSATVQGSASFVTNTATFRLSDGWLSY